MKRLDFPAATADLDLLNFAYVGALNPEMKLNPVEIRTHAKILDKLEAVGVKQTDGTGYKLAEGNGATVLLEDAERELLKRCCETMHWNPAASRKVVHLFDLIDAAPTYVIPAPDAAPAGSYP